MWQFRHFNVINAEWECQIRSFQPLFTLERHFNHYFFIMTFSSFKWSKADSAVAQREGAQSARQGWFGHEFVCYLEV